MIQMIKIPTVMIALLVGGVTLFAQERDDSDQKANSPADIEISYPNSNPLGQALKPLPETAVFKMDGYYLWDPSVIKDGDLYHLFCSRWEAGDKGMNGWKASHVIRASSASLYGPYEFQEVVLHPDSHPWATEMIHNPKITKSGDQFLIYHIGKPGWSTGFAYADSIEGPWRPVPEPVFQANNPSILIRPDGSAYAVSKKKPKTTPEDGRWDTWMTAWEAPDVNGPYTQIGDGENLLPNNFQLEDPTIWWANDQYNVICNDWKGRATGVQKAPVYYTSKDGIHYTLFSPIPILDPAQGLPMENGERLEVPGFERPQVYLNEKQEVIALLGAIRPEGGNPTRVVIVPVDHFVPKN
jgi:hypothetical protein